MPVIAKVVLPEKGFTQKKFNKTVNDLQRYMTGIGASKCRSELNKTTEGWGQRPTFSQLFKKYTRDENQTGMSVVIYPTGKGTLNWVRITKGTRAREIVSTKRPMVFQPGYNPRTTPQGRWGQTKSRYGPWIKTYAVGVKKKHRIEPRNFAQFVIKRIGKQIQGDMDRIVALGIRR